MMDWIRENQPFINFGLLVGAVLYTIITAFILRVSARQLRASVQPALTLKWFSVGVERDRRQPYLNPGPLTFHNSGSGAALNLISRIAVHAGGAASRYPQFDRQTTRVPTAIQAGGDFSPPSLHTAFKEGFGPSGAPVYEQLNEYEVFISYSSIVGAKYLTHVSIGQMGSIDSFYVGEKTLRRQLLIWIGVRWRFYRQWVPIWLKYHRRRSIDVKDKIE
jgi:hypothetical protein